MCSKLNTRCANNRATAVRDADMAAVYSIPTAAGTAGSCHVFEGFFHGDPSSIVGYYDRFGRQTMRHLENQYDFCVVGGGMAGTIAAIAAARHGARTALIQDRPMLGGNASSEIRMHICGAHGENNRETGILEEMFLENHYRNPLPNYSIWDSIIYGTAKYQPGLDVFLNASVYDVVMAGGAARAGGAAGSVGDATTGRSGTPRERKIEAVKAWQFTSETWWTIRAKLFADCTGDGIIAPLSGADYRIGREGQDEYGESIAPEQPDSKTMGLSCLFQAREYDHPRTFIPPAWAHRFTKQADLNGRGVDIRKTNYWWLEVGGDKDSIHDTEELRDELLRIAFGVWDYIKNYSDRKEEFANWDLDWQGFLPGKRESRRYIGDHVLTQSDVESGGHFEDVVAYGGWSMDDHFPAGFHHPEKGTIFHPAPSPYGIPYRTLYSRNVGNLFCAGRDHSASHVAMSSTRVMATCSVMGQAVGTAASIAAREGTGPRGVYEHHLPELQVTLMDDDAWLPFRRRPVSATTLSAVLSGPGECLELLRNGVDRPTPGGYNGWIGPIGAAIELEWEEPTAVSGLRVVFDSDLNRADPARNARHENKGTAKNMRHYYGLDVPPWKVPETLVRAAAVEVDYGDGNWKEASRLTGNFQRLVRIPLDFGRPIRRLRLRPEATWGDAEARVFSVDVL